MHLFGLVVRFEPVTRLGQEDVVERRLVQLQVLDPQVGGVERPHHGHEVLTTVETHGSGTGYGGMIRRSSAITSGLASRQPMRAPASAQALDKVRSTASPS